jgi:hypothetical protein
MMGTLADRDLGSALAHGLERASAVCRRTLEAYAPAGSSAESSAAAAALMRATAALEAALRLHTRDVEVRGIALRVAATLTREAARELRASGFDERLLRGADACERAAFLCEQADAVQSRAA